MYKRHKDEAHQDPTENECTGRGDKAPYRSKPTRYLTERDWQYSCSRRIISDKSGPAACLNFVVKRKNVDRIASWTRSSSQWRN
jgi:hypothetical protein